MGKIGKTRKIGMKGKIDRGDLSGGFASFFSIFFFIFNLYIGKLKINWRECCMVRIIFDYFGGYVTLPG